MLANRITCLAALLGFALTGPLVAADVTVEVSSDTVFNAVVYDQFGDPIEVQPEVSWTATGGSLSASNGASTTYTAGTTLGDSYQIEATSGALSASRSIAIIEALPEPPPAGSDLVAWFKYDGSGSTATDSSSNGLDGSISGNADRGVGVYSGTALHLDGSTRVDLDQQQFNDAFTARTFATWVRADDTSALQMIFEAGGSTNGWGVRIDNGNYYAAVRDDSSESGISAAIPDSDWHHIAIRFDSGDFRLYIDGAEAATGTASYSDVSEHSDEAGIGGINGSDAMDGDEADLTGALDDTRIYSRALTAVEIADLAGTTPPVNDPPVVDAGDDLEASLDRATGEVAVSVTTSSATDSDPLSYEWTSGGQASVSADDWNALQPTFTFTAAGTYTLTLEVDDGVNDPVTDSFTATIHEPDSRRLIMQVIDETLWRVIDEGGTTHDGVYDDINAEQTFEDLESTDDLMVETAIDNG